MRALVALAVLAVVLAISVADANIYYKYYRTSSSNSTEASTCSGAYSFYTRIPWLCGRWYSSETGYSYTYYWQEVSCGLTTAVYDYCSGDTCASSTCFRITVDTNTCTYSSSNAAYLKRTCTLSAGSVAATLVGAAAVVLATLF